MDRPSSFAKPKVVVVMGATGSGKSRLAIDLATSGYFSPGTFEVVNADSMQVYRGLDVLTNKVTLQEQKGVPHHLLGVVDTATEFTSRDFRDIAVPIIDDILARGCLPIVVGGTNYYIQALVSPFLIDDLFDDMNEYSLRDNKEEQLQKFQGGEEDSKLLDDYVRLKELDPTSANRIHPNDHRKVRRYLNMYANTGVLPSELLQGKTSKNWGQPCNYRYDCCFLWVDVSLPILDRFVEERVDRMMDNGLFKEVYSIYNINADYTRGLRQAIGVREFEDFFSSYFSDMDIRKFIENTEGNCVSDASSLSSEKVLRLLKGQFIGRSTLVEKYNTLLDEAIQKLKLNTCRLVRRQRRRLNRLGTLFGWNLHYLDATNACKDNSEESWMREVVEPCMDVVKTFLSAQSDSISSASVGNTVKESLESRNLWTQYKCEACGDRILRGAHEWEQHRLGRGHRKRVAKTKKNRYYMGSSSPVASEGLSLSPSAISQV